MNKKRYKCGCVFGETYCKEAIKLWRIVNEQFYAGFFPGDIEYEKAKIKYHEHFENLKGH